MLPSGRDVHYRQLDGEAIPSEVNYQSAGLSSAITDAQDAIAEFGVEAADERGQLQVPYSEYARLFYLPQWVVVNADDNLLVSSLEEAENTLASMQSYVALLHAAVAIAPYMVADNAYQQKRYGMLGQLVNQGRGLARCEAEDIIDEVLRRKAQSRLNRGLSISLPYFDDQALMMKALELEVVPSGRIAFVPAFMVLACRREEVKVAQDTRLSPSTRKHLLSQLKTLEKVFSQR